MTTHSSAPAATSPKLTGEQRKAIVAGSIGNAVEWVDWALYATLAPVFASQFFGSDDPAVNLLSTLAICGFASCPDNPVRYELFQRR